jgi:hypothetical protein
MAQQQQQPKSASSMKHGAAQDAGKHRQSRHITEEQRYRMIAEAAYLIAEQRGFQGDMALNDWLRAEAEVGARFAASH